MNNLGSFIGEICKTIFPIREQLFLGNPNSSLAICTLSSLDLLKKISTSEILNKVSIAGRLLSENKGIDEIIQYVNNNKNTKTILICGKEVWGHKAGHSLLKLHKNGIDNSGRIINSISPDPFLTVPKSKIDYFRKEIVLINMINETRLEKIKQKIS